MVFCTTETEAFKLQRFGGKIQQLPPAVILTVSFNQHAY